MKEAVGSCSGSKLAVGSIVSVLVTVNECVRVESEVPPPDKTTGMTAVLVNRNNNDNQTSASLQSPVMVALPGNNVLRHQAGLGLRVEVYDVEG